MAFPVFKDGFPYNPRLDWGLATTSQPPLHGSPSLWWGLALTDPPAPLADWPPDNIELLREHIEATRKQCYSLLLLYTHTNITSS